MYSVTEVENRLYEVMSESGMSPASGQRLDITSGQLVRYQIQGHRQGTKNGAYIVYLDDRPAGCVQNWKTGEKATFTMKGLPPLSAEDNEKFRQQMEQDRVKRAKEEQKKHALTARKALAMWNSGIAPDPNFTYLQNKKVPAYNLKQGKNETRENESGNRKGGNTDVLLVPLYDTQSKQLINLQQIYKDGSKYPLTGGKMKGVFTAIGKSNEGAILICEGWATGATLYKLTGHMVICAMSAGNLSEIARFTKQLQPNREILICADNDHQTAKKEGKNPGIAAAIAAAEASSLGAPVWPDFAPDEDGSDWNDYMILHGEEAAKTHFRQKYEEAHSIMEQAPAGTIGTELFPDQNSKGKILGTIDNVKVLLRFYKIQAKYNEVTKQQEIYIPGVDNETDNQLEVNTNTIISLAAKHDMPQTRIASFVDVIAEENRYNPVRDWIASREWDGQPRLSEFMRTTIIPKDGFDRHTVDLILRKWMLSAVAAVFTEPAKGREPFSSVGVLVFQGAQGDGKTRWFKRLAPEGSGWIGEGKSIDPSKKDTMLGALRFWITELGELESTLKKDMAMLKAFITDTQDVIRVPYARRASVFPRRTVFGGTVNQDEFLFDMTGNRRWWCIPIESIDYMHNFDMQQVWAEVRELYDRGATWYPTREESKEIEFSSWRFVSPDPIMDLILGKYEWSGYENMNEHMISKKTATEVLLECGMENPKSAEVRTCGIVLRKLTKREPHKSTGGQRVYYIPPKKM